MTIERQLRGDIDTFVRDDLFPCVAAKSASVHGNIAEYLYLNMNEATKDAEILEDVGRFIETAERSSSLCSFVAAFQGPSEMNEVEFEQAMWERLQALHDLDTKVCNWDRSVSSDPASPDFSFSLRGKAFFVIGLHPNASRLSRRY